MVEFLLFAILLAVISIAIVVTGMMVGVLSQDLKYVEDYLEELDKEVAILKGEDEGENREEKER